MPRPPLKSQLVERVMPDATEEEKAEASWRWFDYIEILNEIAEERERLAADSHEAKADGTVDDTHTIV